MPDRDYITVSELNYYINRIFEAEDLLHNFPVVGEVSGRKVVNGNCYFTLKDQRAQIKVVYFGVNDRYVPSDGEQVLVRGSVDYYEPNGQLSVKAYEITRFGVGLMHAQLQALKEKLEKEGLFDEAHKKPMPKFPVNIGIITSVKGAALQDILSTMIVKHKSRQNLSIIDVRVQGENCVNDVVTALTYADAYGFDVILLARGGGSFEDLYPFNDERMVRTLYEMKTPVVSAIGHETDYTLCDFVSDFRAITPTAGAEKIAVEYEKEKSKIFELTRKAGDFTSKKYNTEKENLLSVIDDISDEANSILSENYSKIMRFLELSRYHTERKYDFCKANVSKYVALLDNLNPAKLLDKGYFRVVYNGKSIHGFSKIKVGSQIEIIGNKEKVTAEIRKKEKL